MVPYLEPENFIESSLVKYFIKRNLADVVEMSVEVHLLKKSLRPDGPAILWELRGFIARLKYDGRRFQLSKWVADHLGGWRFLWRDLGGELCDFLLSEKSAASPRKHAGMQACLDVNRGVVFGPEFVLATKNLLVLLVWSVRNLRYKQRRTLVQRMVGELVALVPGGMVEDLVAGFVPAGDDNNMGCQPGCRHMRRIQRHRQPGSTELPSLITELVGEMDCDIVQQWLRAIIDRIASAIDEHVLTAEWPATPDKIPVMRGRCQAMRLDTVATKHVAVTVVRSGKSRSSIAYAKATDIMKRRTAGSQIEKQLANYLFTGCKSFHGQQQLSLTYDCSTCSRQETMALGVYSHRLNKVMWLPPQVGVVRVGRCSCGFRVWPLRCHIRQC